MAKGDAAIGMNSPVEMPVGRHSQKGWSLFYRMPGVLSETIKCREACGSLAQLQKHFCPPLGIAVLFTIAEDAKSSKM